MSAFYSYLQGVRGAIASSNGPELARLMRVDDDSTQQAVYELFRSVPNARLEDQARKGGKRDRAQPVAATCHPHGCRLAATLARRDRYGPR